MSHYPAVMLYHYSVKSVQQPDISMKHSHYAVAELTDATAQLWVLLCVHVWMIPCVYVWGAVVCACVGAVVCSGLAAVVCAGVGAVMCACVGANLATSELNLSCNAIL